MTACLGMELPSVGPPTVTVKTISTDMATGQSNPWISSTEILLSDNSRLCQAELQSQPGQQHITDALLCGYVVKLLSEY